MKSSSSSRFPVKDSGCLSFSSVGRGAASGLVSIFSGLDGPTILMVRISVSGSGFGRFSCFSSASKNRSVVSESCGAV